MNPIEVTVGDHLLRVLPVSSLLDVDFDSFRSSDKHLVLVMRDDLRSDAPGLTTFFETTLGRRGVLTGARTDHPPALEIGRASCRERV